MIPWLVVAFGVGVWVGYLVGYCNMIAARKEARTWAREATLAWAYADHQEQRADREYDAGWQNGVGILADMGRIDP